LQRRETCERRAIKARGSPKSTATTPRAPVYCGNCCKALTFGQSSNSMGNLSDYFYRLGRKAYERLHL